ncbi:unnamed protein product [marine sediment metagenome]|uniref:Uncharacterized protein n=1 Tax=marine sediment metagenome TaxID=412755 RepID=X1TIT8_9ZZZZ
MNEKALKEKLEELRKNRVSHFKVIVDRPRKEWDEEDDLLLNITHNGRQWGVIGLTFDEAEEVMRKLQKALEKSKSHKKE